MLNKKGALILFSFHNNCKKKTNFGFAFLSRVN